MKDCKTHAERIIDFYYQSKPRLIWEMDQKTLNTIHNWKDDNGVYLWTPEPNLHHLPGHLLGIPITIAQDQCFQLRYQFADGSFHVIDTEFDLWH